MQVQRFYAYIDSESQQTAQHFVSAEDPENESMMVNKAFRNMVNPCHPTLAFKGTVFYYHPKRWLELRDNNQIALCAKCEKWAYWTTQEHEALCKFCAL